MQTRQQQRSIVIAAILLLVVSISYFAYLVLTKSSDTASAEVTVTSADGYDPPSSIQDIFKGIRFDQPNRTTITQSTNITEPVLQEIEQDSVFTTQESVLGKTLSKPETTQQRNSPLTTPESFSFILATTAATKPVIVSQRPTTSKVATTSQVVVGEASPKTDKPTTTATPTEIFILPFGEAGVPVGYPLEEPLLVSGIDPIESITWEILDSNVSGASISRDGVLRFTPTAVQSISVTVRATANGGRITRRGGAYYSFDPVALERN